jgi:hypothetical protein
LRSSEDRLARHVALLGDSVFDNLRYTSGAPDVVSHLRSMLPPDWRASLLAVDGTTTEDFSPQLARVPADATDLVISVGGNNALLNADLLDTKVASTAEALDLFHDRLARFEASYRDALGGAQDLKKAVLICTIYGGNLETFEQARRARVALALFNDVILRVAFELRISALDLRAVCSAPVDFANPIEPSGVGGAKIATAIARALGALESGRTPSSVFP